MNKRRCIHCGCKFYPQKHIKNQRYCSKKECQNARISKWRHLKLKYDKDYQDNQKAAQLKWKLLHPDYWLHYKRSTKDNKKILKKSMVKILVKKGVLTNLRKLKAINCNCRLVLTT
jgi:hypothetical protein